MELINKMLCCTVQFYRFIYIYIYIYIYIQEGESNENLESIHLSMYKYLRFSVDSPSCVCVCVCVRVCVRGVCIFIYRMLKVKQSYYRPGQAQRVQAVWDSQISRQSAHEGGKFVSPTYRPPSPPRKYSWYSFLLDAESNPGP